MKKILFLAVDFNQENIISIEYSKKTFYATLANALQEAGNEVLCINVDAKKRILPQPVIEIIKDFDPDICLLANYGILDLAEIVNCPLCYFDIDSLNNISMETLYRIRNNIKRCCFIISNPHDKDILKERFNAKDEQIILVKLPCATISHKQPKKHDVLLFGTNFLVAQDSYLKDTKMLQAFVDGNAVKSLSSQVNNKGDVYVAHMKNEEKRLITYTKALNKNRFLIKLFKRRFNFDIKGPGWRGNYLRHYPELVAYTKESDDYDINNLRQTYNEAKIVLFFDDGAFIGGEYLRLLDALSSDACVVAQKGIRYEPLLSSIGVPIFNDDNDLQEICKELLEDETKRESIIKRCHDEIKNNYNLPLLIEKLNQTIGITYNEKNLKRSIIEKQELFQNGTLDESLLNVEIGLVDAGKMDADGAKSNDFKKTNKSLKSVKESRVKRLLIHFGYDFYNVYKKKCYKLGPIILYEKIEISSNEKHIFILSFPVLRLINRNGCIKVSSLFVRKLLRVPKKIGKKLKEKVNVLKNKYKNKKKHKLLRKKLKNNEKLTVCLFVSRIECWTFDGLYKLLEESSMFEPIVVVKPFMYQGLNAMIEYMNKTFEELKKAGYRVIKTYDENSGEFMDLKKEINPDIVFYTKYWLPQFHKNFYITNFLDKLNFYTSYCFDIAYHPAVMNFELTNLVDRYFMPSEIHKEMAQKAMTNKGVNVYATGSPKLDVFFNEEYIPKDVWKIKGKEIKRIIWAPHHSDNFPKDLYQFNAFYELSEYMFYMAHKYKNQVQIAFKPHPMLKPYLYKKWGEETTDAYYTKWQDLENGQLESGAFVDLFLTSDAMIMDSISFIAEYTATNKPALFTVGTKSRVKLNDFGEINYGVLYHTDIDLKKDIERFIKNVVINGNDIKKEKRTAFINSYLKPATGKTAAQNIYDNIIEEIMT